MRIDWSSRASLDLEAIISYIGQDSEQNASLVFSRIQRAVSLLGTAPLIGTPIVDGSDRRRLAVPRTGFLVYYAVKQTSIRIVSIQRGTRIRG